MAKDPIIFALANPTPRSCPIQPMLLEQEAIITLAEPGQQRIGLRIFQGYRMPRRNGYRQG